MTTWRHDKIGTKIQFFLLLVLIDTNYWNWFSYSIKEGHESYFHTLTPRSKYAACLRQEKARFGVSAKSPPLLLPVFFVLLKKPWMTWTKQLVKCFWLNYQSKFWSPNRSLFLAGDFCRLHFVVTFGFVILVTWICQCCFHVILALCWTKPSWSLTKISKLV